MVGGTLCILGLQKRNVKKIGIYTVLKTLQLVVISFILILNFLNGPRDPYNVVWFVTWLLFGGYALYSIASLRRGMGEDPLLEECTVSLHPEEMISPHDMQVRYVTPLLQGETHSIPVSVSQ